MDLGVLLSQEVPGTKLTGSSQQGQLKFMI